MLDKIMNQGHSMRRMLQATNKKVKKRPFSTCINYYSPKSCAIFSQEPVVILTSTLFVYTQDKIADVDK